MSLTTTQLAEIRAKADGAWLLEPERDGSLLYLRAINTTLAIALLQDDTGRLRGTEEDALFLCGARRAILDLYDALTEALEDSARLDWLDLSGRSVKISGDHKWDWAVQDNNGGTCGVGPDLRAAIDAAMQAEKEPK
jgi:hypothetical protein